MKKILIFLVFTIVLQNLPALKNYKILKQVPCYNNHYFNGYEVKKNKILLVTYKNLIGFRVGTVFILTVHKIFNQTIKNNKKNYEWKVYVSGNNETLRVNWNIYVLTTYDYETDILDFIFIFPFGDESMLHYTIITINKKDLK